MPINAATYFIKWFCSVQYLFEMARKWSIFKPFSLTMIRKTSPPVQLKVAAEPKKFHQPEASQFLGQKTSHLKQNMAPVSGSASVCSFGWIHRKEEDYNFFLLMLFGYLSPGPNSIKIFSVSSYATLEFKQLNWLKLITWLETANKNARIPA